MAQITDTLSPSETQMKRVLAVESMIDVFGEDALDHFLDSDCFDFYRLGALYQEYNRILEHGDQDLPQDDQDRLAKLDEFAAIAGDDKDLIGKIANMANEIRGYPETRAWRNVKPKLADWRKMHRSTTSVVLNPGNVYTVTCGGSKATYLFAYRGANAWSLASKVGVNVKPIAYYANTAYRITKVSELKRLVGSHYDFGDFHALASTTYRGTGKVELSDIAMPMFDAMLNRYDDSVPSEPSEPSVAPQENQDAPSATEHGAHSESTD